MTHRPSKDATLEFPAVKSNRHRRPSRISIWTIVGILLLAMMFASDARAACSVPATATVKGHRISADQRRNTTIALRLADQMHAPFKHKVAVVAAATQEDSQHNRAAGHGTSVGYLQLIDIHGTVAWRMRVRNSAGWFLRGARQLDPRGIARLATTRQHTGLIQRVQRSGRPYAYNRWIAEAVRTINKYRATCA